MIHCRNCGEANAAASQFCRFCGTKFRETAQPFESAPPRPYAWKTDEYQTNAGARSAHDAFQQYIAPNHLQALESASGYALSSFDPHYHCPKCGSNYSPRVERRVSTAGWIVFAALLIVFFPLCWIGLLMKEDVYVCPGCMTHARAALHR